MNIFITGGGSGIGLKLAQQYKSNGHRVGICSRNADKVTGLDDFKIYKVDVTVKSQIEDAVSDFIGDEALDIVIISAGQYIDDINNNPTADECISVLTTNICGVVNTLEVSRSIMQKNNNGGKIAVIASVSSLLDYPKSTLYSKTKRAVMQICKAYRSALRTVSIDIICVLPGYVDTLALRKLNNNDLSSKPFVVSEEFAANAISEAIEKSKEIVIFPAGMKRLIKFLSLLPRPLLELIMLNK